MDVFEGQDGLGTCTCEKTTHDGKESKGKDGYDSALSEDVNNETDGLLVGGDGSAKFDDVCSNYFTNEDNVDLVIEFGLMLLWYFP